MHPGTDAEDDEPLVLYLLAVCIAFLGWDWTRPIPIRLGSDRVARRAWQLDRRTCTHRTYPSRARGQLQLLLLWAVAARRRPAPAGRDHQRTPTARRNQRAADGACCRPVRVVSVPVSDHVVVSLVSHAGRWIGAATSDISCVALAVWHVSTWLNSELIHIHTYILGHNLSSNRKYCRTRLRRRLSSYHGS
jgi:hypothetical protein